MLKKTTFTLLLAGLSLSTAWAAPGDYDPAYDQGGGYGAATLDERVAKLEKKLSGDSQMELLNRVEQLQSDVLRLRGEVEDLTHRLEIAKRQQKEQFFDLDRRVQSLTPPPPAIAEQATNPTDQTPSEPDPNAQQQANLLPTQQAPALSPPLAMTTPIATPPPVPAIAPPPAPASTLSSSVAPSKPSAPTYSVSTRPAPPAAPSADSEARQAAYQKGFNLMKDGKYSDAIKELKNFLAAYPKGEYSDNAAYWLGEAHYVNRDLPAAREAFRKVVKDYPQAAKVSDAQLKLGYIDYDTGQWGTARDTLNTVIKHYPDTSAAKLAQKRLDKMTQEGH